MIRIDPSGNCNFAYISGLRAYLDDMPSAMAYVLTTPPDYYSRNKSGLPTYRQPFNGMYLFAQGSEDPVKDRPYAHRFKAFIEENKLGEVHELPPVPNPQHANKKGILFVWILDHKACAKWWNENVLKPHKSNEKIRKEVS